MLRRASRAALPGYAELFCRSSFSFLSGASLPGELVERAQALRYAALAITDECSLAGIVRAHEASLQFGMPLVVGSEFRLACAPAEAAPQRQRLRQRQQSQPQPQQQQQPPQQQQQQQSPQQQPRQAPQDSGAARAQPRLVVLAESIHGYRNLVRWITLARGRAPKGEYRAWRGDIEGKAPSAPMLAGLSGCFVLLLPDAAQPFETVLEHASWLRTWVDADRAAIGLRLLRGPHDAALVRTVERVSEATGLRLAAVGGALMHLRSRKPLLDVLTATRLNKPVSECGLELPANAECHLRSRFRLAQLYRAEWMQAAVDIAQRCRFSMAELHYQYPREIVPPGHTPTSWLRQLVFEGARDRFGKTGVPAGVPLQIRHELRLIRKKEYEAYFLTVADIVHWARSQGILCQGRGSAANSVVCYCLGVTAVSPAREATLLFERFISLERDEPPDIDVDFEHQRREEVIQYIYRKYGRHRAALTAVVISYRPRSALRDVGRALGIDSARIDAVSKGQQWFDGRRVAVDRLRENGFDPDSPPVRMWMELTQQLIGFPRHLSQHPGGFVIARDDLAELVPVEMAAMDGRSVVQWDKDDLDTLKLIKVDILALGMLSAIRRALEFVGAKTGRPLQLHEIPEEGDDVWAMLGKADSVGVFQVESRAQMSMLPRLKPVNYYDLVIEVAIVRPGPIQGGMVHPYLRRRNGEEPVDLPRPELKPALGRTLGVPIFQEQVMQIAMIAADFTAGEADQLRRAMAAWKRKGGLGPFQEKLVGRMVEKGYGLDYAERIFKQVEGFGEYGFPESHAASFALLVWASAWIKCRHPDAFLAALLNSQPMGFYAPAQLVRDAREHGVTVLPVDVTVSEWESTLEGMPPAVSADAPAGTAAVRARGRTAADAQEDRVAVPAAPPGLQPVRLGFSRIVGFDAAAGQRIVSARQQSPFAGAEDLARRAGLDARHLQLLAQADALRALSGHRHRAAWSVAGVDTRATPLLRDTRTQEEEPLQALPPPSAAAGVAADYRATGLSLVQHPLALLRPQLAAFKVQTANVLRGYPDGRLARASGIVTHRQRPETAKGVIFVTLEDETGSVNVIVWPQVAQTQRRALLGSTLLTVYGVWQCAGEVRHLVARRLVDHSALLQGLAPRSRDFH